MSINHNIGYVV